MLITGFGPFPGAPSNPSATLARTLARSRRLPGVRLSALTLPTEWKAAEDFPALLAQEAPDIVLMIGLAARRRALCIEISGRNGGGSFPDVARRRPVSRVIAPGGPARIACPAPSAALLHALSGAGVPARLSRDAGRYICNALAYRAYGWARAEGRRAVFIHVPLPRPGLTLAQMHRALEALLRRLVAQRCAAPIAAARR
ncbi:peptidase C15 [Ancylobacter sp. WKF20]|uniref:pyroglutamyl-peptidase I family protein n=1 Tax=Ancylobacter sp. WKF20 TaxID=3039801 RepID=UPI0024343BA4|nr:peptidase C15 [Ancylobacter sp. WKF20]WGD32267.1 peptidase C15 [Ancylobacter sp. WKF20]